MDLLRQHRVKFVQNLHSVSSVIDDLFSSRVLTRGNKNSIECRQNSDDQVRELLDIITCKGPKVLDRFYNALITTDNVELAELLKSDTGRLSKMETRGVTPLLPPKHEPAQQKVLVLYGKEENKEIKENIQSEPDTCTRIIEKIKNAASSHLKSLVIIILGDFDGDAVEDIMSHNKIPLSEICATLKSILPGKQKLCVLLHPENTEVSTVLEKPDNTCQLVALRENRLKDLNKLKGSTDDFFSRIKKFINENEIIWPSQPGYILLLDGPEENKEVGEFLRKQWSNLNFTFDTETCTLIENKLKSRVLFSPKPAFLVFFLLGQFNGTEVEDVCSGDGVHITHISMVIKKMLPKIMKICILLQRDNVKLDPVRLDKENDDTLLIVSLTNERLKSLMEKLNHSTTDSVPFCINNFVNSNEKIW